MSAPSSKPDDASASRPSRPSAKPSTANSSSPPGRHPLLFSSHDRYQSQPADRIRIVSPCPLPGWAITIDGDAAPEPGAGVAGLLHRPAASRWAQERGADRGADRAIRHPDDAQEAVELRVGRGVE